MAAWSCALIRAHVKNTIPRIDLVIQGQRLENLRIETMNELCMQMRELSEKNPEKGRTAILSAFAEMTVYPFPGVQNLALDMLKTIKSKSDKIAYLNSLKACAQKDSSLYVEFIKK